MSVTQGHTAGERLSQNVKSHLSSDGSPYLSEPG